jgi:hypothetical protein
MVRKKFMGPASLSAPVPCSNCVVFRRSRAAAQDCAAAHGQTPRSSQASKDVAFKPKRFYDAPGHGWADILREGGVTGRRTSVDHARNLKVLSDVPFAKVEKTFLARRSAQHSQRRANWRFTMADARVRLASLNLAI